MQNIFSKKIIWSIAVLIGVAAIIGGIVYFTSKRSTEEVVPSEAQENASSSLPVASLAEVELVKEMSVSTSTAPANPALSPQQAKKTKAAMSASPTAKPIVRSVELQKLLDSMSVKP